MRNQLPLMAGNVLLIYITCTSRNLEGKKNHTETSNIGILGKKLTTDNVRLKVRKKELTEYSNMKRENQLEHSSDK